MVCREERKETVSLGREGRKSDREERRVRTDRDETGKGSNSVTSKNTSGDELSVFVLSRGLDGDTWKRRRREEKSAKRV